MLPPHCCRRILIPNYPSFSLDGCILIPTYHLFSLDNRLVSRMKRTSLFLSLPRFLPNKLDEKILISCSLPCERFLLIYFYNSSDGRPTSCRWSSSVMQEARKFVPLSYFSSNKPDKISVITCMHNQLCNHHECFLLLVVDVVY